MILRNTSKSLCIQPSQTRSNCLPKNFRKYGLLDMLFEYNDTDRRPMVLRCGHTYCYSCICGIIGTQPECPQDRSPIHMGIEQIPPNYELILALENLRKADHRSISIPVEVRRQREGELTMNQRTSQIQTCDSGHLLQWNANTVQEYNRRGFSHAICDVCRANMYGGSWHCEPCTYDMCTTCYGWVENSPEYFSDFIKCYKKHNFRRTSNIRLLVPTNFHCNVCKLPNAEGQVLYCRPCGVAICSNCTQALERTIPISYNLKCQRNHKAVWTFDLPNLYYKICGQKAYVCDDCGHNYIEIGSFHCDPCKFDLCLRCTIRRIS